MNVIDWHNLPGAQPAPFMLELFTGTLSLGTFPVKDDADVARTVNACPVVLTHYLVTLRTN